MNTSAAGDASKHQKRKRRARKKKSQKSKDSSSVSKSNKPNSNFNNNKKNNKSNSNSGNNNGNNNGNSNNNNNSKNQAVHLPHAKITIRNIRNNEKNGTAESMIQLLKELIHDRNLMKCELSDDSYCNSNSNSNSNSYNNSNNNSRNQPQSQSQVVPPLDVVLDHTCLDNIMDRVHHKTLILNQLKEVQDGKEGISDVNAETDADADADDDQSQDDNRDADIDMEDTGITTEKDEPIVDVVNSAANSNVQMNETNSDAINKQNPHSIAARLLYLVPPKLSRRRGELSGHCYLALYPPMPTFIQEKLKLIQDEKDLAMVEAAKAKAMAEQVNETITCSVSIGIGVGVGAGQEGESVHVLGERELTIDVDMDGNKVDTSPDDNANTGAVLVAVNGDGDGDGDGDGGEEAQSAVVNANESASVNESAIASASSSTPQEQSTDDIASPVPVQPLEMQQEQKQQQTKQQTKPATKITAADRSKALAQSRLLLNETLASLTKLCKDDSKKDKPYSGILIEMSSNQKIWKVEEKGSVSGNGGGSGREGRKFGMAAKYDATIEQNDDFKEFLDSKKRMEEELSNRPKPQPGGGPLAEMTNISTGTGSGVDDRMGSAGGDPVAAIVIHLREKQEAALRAKKKASADKKKSTKARGSGDRDRGKKASSADAGSGSAGKVDGDKSKKKSKRKSKAKQGESTKKVVSSAPKLLLKK